MEHDWKVRGGWRGRRGAKDQRKRRNLEVDRRGKTRRYQRGANELLREGRPRGREGKKRRATSEERREKIDRVSIEERGRKRERERIAKNIRGPMTRDTVVYILDIITQRPTCAHASAHMRSRWLHRVRCAECKFSSFFFFYGQGGLICWKLGEFCDRENW